jgi:Uma2 family endonuclease
MAIALSTNALSINQDQHTLSLEEFLALPETKPAKEYINGKTYQKPMPQTQHSRLATKFAGVINDRGEPDCLVSAFCELRCKFGGMAIVPDVVVLEWDHITLDENDEPINKIEIPPDWLIEILSPDQSSILVIDKIDFALKNGSKLGWLIAPEEKRILTSQGNGFIYHQGMDILPVLDVLGDWQLSVQDVFNMLKYKRKEG